jgi:hypothetical protein
MVYIHTVYKINTELLYIPVAVMNYSMYIIYSMYVLRRDLVPLDVTYLLRWNVYLH